MERSDSRDFYSFTRASSSDNNKSTVFDASQYEFFGQSLEEVELGGLDVDDATTLVGGHVDDEEYHLFDKREVSDMDDLATTFAKLNRVVTGPKHPGVIGDKGSGSFSRESSSATDWTQDNEFTSWLDQHMLEEQAQEANWSSQQQSSANSKSLYRTSSYPQQQTQLQHYSSEPIIVPESSFTSFPSPGNRTQQSSPSHLHRAPSLPGGSQLTFSAPNASPLSNSTFHLSGLSHGPPHYGNNLARYASCGPTLGSMVQPPHWVTDPGLLHGDHSGLLHSLAQQQHLQLPPRNGFTSQQLISLQQRQSLAHLAALQSQLYSSYPSPSHKVPFGVGGEVREHKHKSSHRSRKNRGISQQASDLASQKSESGLQFRSKYMTSEEIESILKMQHSNSHSNDPYVNDYYHQARLIKNSAGSRAKLQFCPSHLKDHHSRSRNSSDQQPQVHVDALGKITLPFISRPRALLEVDSPPSSGDGRSDHKGSGKHLEDEPLVAARVTIEDAFGVLIDIVDIDRTLQFNRPQDGGAQLRRKRQILLEGLATSLQLVDPFSKTGQKAGLTTKDDIVFLRIATLPKGRKLLTKYLHLLTPGSEIARVVCMAVFRHLRFLFGGLPSDSTAAETIANLAKAVTVCVQAMDLRALSACLAAVVCSSEQPPLRPIGSPSGDGASVVLVSLLERAAEVAVAVVPHGNSNDGLWRASFDEFFSLLTKYCRSKYETIHGQNQDNAADVLELAIKREMPAELLRASLRHTNEDQRNFLLNFGRKASPISESATRARGGQINSESVRG
ncbi:unnamed protein product [Arabis nemorensis]|uniref:mRNA decay factor PAT1 domain-containing protein n=1 Tax=Arabis nemorensis TaxID=586526 RepID=A0A565BJU5_9BRAS|nr:unnamed protein product [Arabis nemorensis]